MDKKFGNNREQSDGCNWTYIQIAIVCMLIAIAFVILSFIIKCERLSDILAATSVTFATLVGAILVFSTLELQRKALEEEKRSHCSSLFDSKFHPLLSSFRMDAANMEIIADFLVQKGKDYGKGTKNSYHAEMAFFIASKIVEALKEGIKDQSLKAFDSEELGYELNEFRNRLDALDEEYHGEYTEFHEAVEQERRTALHSFQKPYLLSVYGVTGDVKASYCNVDDETLTLFVLDRLVCNQPTLIGKYIQTLRFMLHIIDGLTNDIDKRDYYLYISCQLGKEEQSFLKHFIEFDRITNTSSK